MSVDLVAAVLDNWCSELDTTNGVGVPTIIVALSGGIDSVVLLHVLNTIKHHHHKTYSLSAIHVNHNISANSQQWQLFCQQYCAALNIPLVSKQCHINRLGGQSLENNARHARYVAFEQLFEQTTKQTTTTPTTVALALAHQENDQVETLLSQLFRGSNLHNIAGMQVVSLKRARLFWRPLLNVSRSSIENYARFHQLAYVDDESNNNTKYLRNFVRHEVLPLLQVWDPYIVGKLLNVGRKLQETLTTLDELASTDLQMVLEPTTSANSAEKINVISFKQLSVARQCMVITMYLKQCGQALPTERMLCEFVAQVTTSAWDRTPKLLLGNNTYLIKQKNYIFLSPATTQMP